MLFPLTEALMKSCHCNNVQLKRSQSGGLSHLEVKVCFLFPNFSLGIWELKQVF